MQKTLACVAVLLAGSLVGCGRDKHREPAAAGYETQPRGHSVPTQVARAEPTQPKQEIETQWEEEPAMTPASGTMTPASGTVPGATPGAEMEGQEPAGLGPGGPVILQYEGANHLAQALCKHGYECGSIKAGDAWCEEVVKTQLLAELESCEQGISRAELQECLTALDQHSCEGPPADPTPIQECAVNGLCAR